jgi:hypothetical protein
LLQAAPEESDRLKKVQEHVEICEKEVGIEHEDALKIAGGDFTLRDEKSQVITSSRANEPWIPQLSFILTSF